MNEFDYLSDSDIYLDSACQSLRPRCVIEAVDNYYVKHNSCGERVKYEWGKITDEKVEAVREKVLKFLKLSSRKYATSFTLNTTYGINLILSQIKADEFKKVMTSEIEHNSPFLSTMVLAKRLNIAREVMKRREDGSIDVKKYDFSKAVVVVNCAANFDGRKLLNIKEIVKAVHKAGGIIIIDAAQAMAHSHEILHGVEPDAICFSAHKLYAPSLGVIAWRNDLADKLEVGFIGGGMVDDVEKESYLLSAENKEHRYTRFESGLQAWGEIVGLGVAIDWLNKLPKSAWKNLDNNSRELYDFLHNSTKVHLVNHEANPTISFYVDGIDSHLLSEALSREGIMARSGYFCAHYYLDHVLNLPPLVRFSLSHANSDSDIAKVKNALQNIL